MYMYICVCICVSDESNASPVMTNAEIHHYCQCTDTPNRSLTAASRNHCSLTSL